MTPARAVYARFRQLIHEATRFGVVGLGGLLVTDGGANLLRYQAGMGRDSSVAIATAASIAIMFLPSRYWTFRHRERTGAARETALYFAVNAIGVAISEGCVELTYPLHLGDGLSYNIALNGGIALATLFRFWSYKKWVWPAGLASSGDATLPEPAGSARARAAASPAGSAGPARPRDGRSRPSLGELARYTLVGVLAYLVAGAGTNLLHYLAGIGPLTSNLIASVAAVAVSYVGHRSWTFRRRHGHAGREGALFFLLNAAGLVIQLTCLGFGVFVLGLRGGLPFNLLLLTGIGLAGLFRYWTYREWVWPAPPPGHVLG